MTSPQNQPTMATVFLPGRRVLPVAIYPRGHLMKSFRLLGLALGASFAFSASAFAQDITIAVAGPLTGGESAFGGKNRRRENPVRGRAFLLFILDPGVGSLRRWQRAADHASLDQSAVH